MRAQGTNVCYHTPVHATRHTTSSAASGIRQGQLCGNKKRTVKSPISSIDENNTKDTTEETE